MMVMEGSHGQNPGKFSFDGRGERYSEHVGDDHRLSKRLSRRAQVILLSEQGMTLREISQESRLSEKNCLKWRKRFQEDRVDGLKDAPRKGRPPVITPWQRAQ